MKVRCTLYNSAPAQVNYIDTSKARRIYRSVHNNCTVIEFGPGEEDYIYINETIEQLTAQLPDGIHSIYF